MTDYFISESAPVNKVTVRRYKEDERDEKRLPCSVHFCQLAMREAVTRFSHDSADSFKRHKKLNGSVLKSKKEEIVVNDSSERGSFERTKSTYRAIGVGIMSFHAYNLLFDECQKSLGAQDIIVADVLTRFDSTFSMLESILKKRGVLYRTQERGRRRQTALQMTLHLPRDDFTLSTLIISIIELVQNFNKALLHRSR